MMKNSLLCVFLTFFVLEGCSTAKFKTKGLEKKTYSYFNSKISIPKKGKVLWMNISYYGSKFNGKKTASGEKYNMFDFTCAHKTLPFGTLLKVTNPENNKSVIVRVNDRGPFVKGRDLDISYAAARKIGLIKYGFKKLKVEILGKNE